MKKVYAVIIWLCVYIGCVIWITYDIKLDAPDRFLICFLGLVGVGGAITFPKLN